MMIYNRDGIRVIQHDFLKLFHVQVWGECDNPRSYGRHYDYCTVLETQSIEEVRKTVANYAEEGV